MDFSHVYKRKKEAHADYKANYNENLNCKEAN